MAAKFKHTSIKAMTDARRTLLERLADMFTESVGSIAFIILNVVWFVIWILINTGKVPGVPIFDPFPFGLLTTAVSLEAIILTLFVLLSQNRAGKVADLRAEIDYSIDKMAEHEITKLLEIVTKIARKNGIRISDDEVLQEMLSTTTVQRIEKKLENDILD